MKRSEILYSVLIALPFFLVGCSKTSEVTGSVESNSYLLNLNSRKAVKIKEYSGQDLFKAIFFGTGDAAKNIFANNLSYRFSSKQFESYQRIENELIEKIDGNNPSFFNEFKISVESGMPQNVKNSIELGGIELENAIGITKEQISYFSNPAFLQKLKLLKETKKNIELSDLNDLIAQTNDVVAAPTVATEWYYVNYYVAGNYIAVITIAVAALAIFLDEEPVPVLGNPEEPAVEADTLGIPSPLSSFQYLESRDALDKDKYIKFLTDAFKK